MRSILLALLLASCGPDKVKPGPPLAGAAEGFLDLPVGTPLAGYTARSLLFTGISRPDQRTSPYTVGFVPSAGLQTRPTVKVLWLHNDDHHLVLVKADLAYMADHVVRDVEARLSEALDTDMTGQVAIATSHSHQSWGTWNAHRVYFLGGDRHHPENDARLVEAITSTALRAWDEREPVALGAGWAKDWDPEDRVYRDRRGENDTLAVWTGEPEYTGKDPYLHVLRVDRLDGSPLAMTMTFGIHGIAVGESSPMASIEASGHIELAMQEQFDEPVVVMHLQGSGGDASPAGRGARFERLEDIGRNAVEPIRALYEAVPTSADPVSLETWTADIAQGISEVHVTREGTVDWRYATPGLADNVVYNEDGSIASPIDEFTVHNGAAFCGSERPEVPGAGIGASVYPYESCVDAGNMTGLIENVFELPPDTPLPMPESTRARANAMLLGPVPTLDIDGSVGSSSLYAGFFPGEPTALFGEQFRRTGLDVADARPWIVGYAQDHEGYLLIPEDWLMGGYEPNINLWGPLQGEYLMEQVVAGSRETLGDEIHQEIELGEPLPDAWDRTLVATGTPEPSPDAGTRLTEAPVDVPLWTPDAMPVQLVLPAEVPRGGLVQMAWIGEDPRSSTPTVTVQRQEGGSWVDVTTHAGRPVTDALPDILLTWTPDPLRAEDGPRTHRWWAAWQAVPHWHDPTGLPLGTYRLRVTGASVAGTAEVWPFESAPYEVVSDSFEVVPATLDVTRVEGGLSVSFPGPEHGFRQLARGGAAAGDNPVSGALRVSLDGTVTTAEGTVTPDGRTLVEIDVSGVREVLVTDPWGNVGALTVE